jgi:predicted nucleic acid-binding protein
VSRYVLDTHACVYALVAPGKLGRRARRAMTAVEAGESEGWIPAAVVAEVVILRELGRIDIGLAQLKSAIEEAPALRFLSLDLRQLDEFAALGALRGQTGRGRDGGSVARDGLEARARRGDQGPA